MAQTILHEQQGLRIHRNERNGFVVCRLHFTADPRKRSEEWRAASKRGMSRAKWEQEFDINYDAQLGEKAFPEIREKREQIVLREGPYLDGKWPQHLQMWGGFDYGTKNPSSFHVYTQVDAVTYAIWELYEPCRNIIEFVMKMKACPYWDQIRYILHDPDMCALKQRDLKTGDVTSVRAQFEQLGITKWMSGNNDEAGWLVRMQKHWCTSEITFKILECCPNLIEEFELATYKNMSERQLEAANYSEGLVDKHNHALDDCKYFMNGATRPKPRSHAARGMLDTLGYSVSSTWNEPIPSGSSADSPARRWGLL